MSFEVFDGNGNRVAKCNDFGEAKQRMRAAGAGSEIRRGGMVVATHLRKMSSFDPHDSDDEREPSIESALPLREDEPTEAEAHQPDGHVDPPEASEYFAGSSTVRFAREVITPETATKMLEGRAPNRTPSDQRIQSYANDMIAGRWVDIHQPIALGPNDELVDGEHRLRAVVRANVPIAMWVARGVPLDNRWAIDQGRARSVGDALRINDGLKHGPKLAKWFRVIESMGADWKATRIVSPARVRELASAYAESVEWALASGPRGRLIARAPVVAALIYAHRVLPEATERFSAKYSTGESLVAGDPAFAMRQSVLGGVPARETDRTYALRTFRCVLGEHRNERIERVNASEEAFAFFRALHAAKDGEA
jgi:hypothetical protein